MTNRGVAVQYDLFGEIEAQERANANAASVASAQASTFLAGSPWPQLLGWWLHSEAIEADLDHGLACASYRRGPDTSGWAWGVWRDGLRFECGDTWPGWDTRPRWCIPWPELHGLRNAFPEITERLTVLADGRGHPRTLGWRWYLDPHALNPLACHPDYLDSEQRPDYYYGDARPETAWRDRQEAWRLVTDAARAAHLRVHRVRS